MTKKIDAHGFSGVKPQVLNSVTRATLDFALAKGISIELISRETGISKRDVIDPEARLPEEIVTKLWLLMREAFPGQSLGIEMAAAAPLSYFGIYTQGYEYAPTVRDALTGIIRFRAILDERFLVSLTEGETEAQFNCLQPNGPDRCLKAEVGLAMSFRLGREILQVGDHFKRVEFAHQPFGPRSQYDDFFGIDVLFEQPNNALVFSKEALDHTPPLANERLFRYVQTNLEQMQQGIAVEPDMPPGMQPVYMAIVETAASGKYSASALAANLGMSQRALQRQVKTHGFELRDLLDKAREANARRLLDQPGLSLSQIAYALGYTDDRAFRRAFKRWSGKTPAEYRRRFATVE